MFTTANSDNAETVFRKGNCTLPGLNTLSPALAAWLEARKTLT